jgi:hypothetical protein
MQITSVNEIRTCVIALQEHLEAEIKMVTDKISDEAHPDGNMEYLQGCAKQVELLKRNLKALKAIGDHAVNVMVNTLSFPTDESSVAASGMRTLLIEVSAGMINQHLLTLTEAKDDGKVKTGEKFTILLPDGTSFSTELCDPGNKLRERGQIRKFYQGEKINPGDKVIMTEVSHGSWKIYPVKSPEGSALAAEHSERNADLLIKELGEIILKPRQTP